MPDDKLIAPKARLENAQTSNLAAYEHLSGYGNPTVGAEGSSQYDTNLVEGISPDRQRAYNQGFGSELSNTVLGAALKVVPTIIGTSANILDLENYGLKSDTSFEESGGPKGGTDYDNWLTSAMNKINQNTEEVTPIYGASQGLSSREGWMNMAKSTLESGTAFAATGMGIGTVLRGVGAAAGGLLGETFSAANTAAFQAAGTGLGELGTSALLTHAEGVQLAANVFDNAYQFSYQDFLKNVNPQGTHEQAQTYALEHASDAAATAHNVNMLNTLLNITSINRMFTPVAQSRELAKQATIKSISQGLVAEGSQEYLEENINNIAENIAMNEAKSQDKKNTTSLVLDSIFSKEGFEAGIGGFFGGVFQTGLTDAKKAVTGEFKRENQRYAQLQQNNTFLNSVEGQQSIKSIIDKTYYTANKIEQINNLAIEGKQSEVELAKKELLQYHALQAFKVGNGKQFEETLELALQNLNPEERVKATEVRKAFKEAEEVYNETVYKVEPSKQDDIYFNTVQRKNLQSRNKDITVEKVKAKHQLLEEISSYRFNDTLRDSEKVAKQTLEDAINNPDLVQKITGLQKADELRTAFKNPVTYPSENSYKESVAKLAENQAQINQNILDYNSIVNGSFYKNKEKATVEETKKQDVVNNEIAYQDSKKKNTEAKEAAKQPVQQRVIPGIDTEAQPVVKKDITGMFAKPEEEIESIETQQEQPTQTETQTITPPQTTEIEAKKTDIEKRRQEKLVEIEKQFKGQDPDFIKFSLDKINKEFNDELKTLETEEETPVIPEPKKLDTEETREFKKGVFEGNTNTVTEDEFISETDPSDGYCSNKIINGYNAVATTSTLGAYNEEGFFVKTGNNLDNINQNILSPNGTIDVGKELYIRTTNDDRKGNGEINPKITDVDGVNHQFAIYDSAVGGSLVGYIHEIDWCNDNNIATQREELQNNVERNRKNTEDIRKSLVEKFKSGVTSVPVKISSKSASFVNTSVKSGPVSDQTQNDDRVVLAVAKKDGFYVNNHHIDVFLGSKNSKLDFKPSKNFFRDYQGMSVMIVPAPIKSATGNVYKVVFLDKSQPLPQNITTSIKQVLTAYLTGDGETLTKFGVQNNRNAVQAYVNKFFYTSFENTNKSNPHYFVVDEFVEKDGSKKRRILANTAAGVQNTMIYNGMEKTAGSTIDVNLNAVLEGRSFNLDLNSNENGTSVSIIENKEIVSKPYEKLAKENSYTNMEGMTLNNLNGEIAYFHNPVLQFDPSEILKETEVEEVKTEPTPETLTIAENNKKKVRETIKPKSTEQELTPIQNKKSPDTAMSPLEFEVTSSGLVKHKSTDKVSGETVEEYIDITKVNDITDTIYNFITSAYLKDNSLKPKQGIQRFIKSFKTQVEFYNQFTDEEYEIIPEEIAKGALPTYEANAKRASEYQEVLDNLNQYLPIVFTKLESSGFKIKNLNTLEFNELIESAKELELEKTLESETEDIINEENTLEKDKFDASSFEVDPLTKLSARMKAFYKSIKSPRLNYLGIPTYVDYQNLHNKVMALLSNKFLSYDQIVNELKKYNTNPSLQQVIEKLQSSDETLRNEFVTHHGKEYTEFVTIKEGKTFNPNRENLTQIVLNSFGTGIQNKAAIINNEGNTIITISQETKDLWDKLEKSENPSIALVKEYLKSVGIEVTDNTLSYMKDYMGTDAFRKEFNERGDWNSQFSKNGLFGNIHKELLKKDGSKIETNSDEAVTTSTVKGEGSFTKLAKVESLYRDTDVSTSFVNGEGKTLFGFTLPNATSIRLSRLKANTGNLLGSLKQISFTKYATWLNDLSNYNFRIFYFDVNDLYGNKDYAKPFHELSDKEQAQTRLTLFTSILGKTKDGNVITRFISSAKSDKTKALGIQYTKFKIEFNGNVLSDTTVESVAKIAYAEYERILKSQDKDQSNIVGYNPSLFYLFPELNKLEELFHGPKITGDETAAKKLIFEKVREILSDEIEFTKSQFEKYGFTKKNEINNTDKKVVVDKDYIEFLNKNINTGVTEADYLATDYTVNQLLANYNYMALFSGDPATAFKKDVKGTLDNYFKRLAKDVAPGQRLANANTSSIKQIFINDPKGDFKISKNFKQIEAILGEKDAKAYADIDIADAQEYTTLSEHLTNLYNEGELTYSEYVHLTNKMKSANKLGINVKFTKEENRKVLKPTKPVYVQNIPDTINDVDKVVYIKSSSIPLFAQITKGTGLDALRVAMEKNGIHRAALQSAAKMGAVNVLNFEDIKADSDLTTNISLLPREGFGIQQAVPYDETKTEILQGSQLQKLIFEGLGGAFKGLKEEFNRLQMQLMDSDFQSLKEDFGIAESANGDLSVSDMTKFTDLLKAELVSRDYNPNDLDSLRLNSKGELEIPLWFNSNATRMESLILSLFTNRVLKQKLNGQAYALASELGTEESLTSQEKNDIITTESYDPKVGLLPQRIVDKDGEIVTDAKKLESLKTMTNEELLESGYTVKGSQVFLPFDFRDNEGNILNIKDFTKVVNGKTIIDHAKLPKKLLEQIGYRIPTQGHNSMAFIEVVGFLPSYMVKSLIASKDFTKQMGSDFDIDKLYIHSNIYYEDGTLSEEESTKDNIVSIYKKILSDPRVLHKILKPLDFGELENVNKALKSIKKFNKPQRSVLSSWQQDENFNTGTAGKIGVGFTSLVSTFSSLIHRKGISISGIEILVNGEKKILRDLSSSKTVDGKRPKIEVISAFQSASVDNIKELLINTINYNEFTNPAFNTLALLGLDEYFISYLFTQDTILDYTEFYKNAITTEEVTALLLVKENIAKTKTKDTPELMSTEEIDLYLEDPTLLSTESLLENLKNPAPKGTIEYFKMQLSIAKLFDEATSTGDELIALQATTNIYTSGLTNNTQDLAGKLKSREAANFISDKDSLFGKINTDIKNNIVEDSYGITTLTPNTPAGMGYEIGRKAHSLMNKFFPYSSSLVTQVQNLIGEPNKKTKKKINDFIKSSLIASSNLFDSPTEDITSLRKRLLFGENSLAHRWLEFKKANPENALGKRLECKTNTDTYPSTIKYLLTTGTRSDDFNIVKTLVEMLNNPETSELAEDTIKSQMMNGGIQLPNNFVKLIPNDYLIKKDFGKDLISLVNDETAAKLYSPVIYKQYIQHNSTTLGIPKKEENVKKGKNTEEVIISSSKKFELVEYTTPEGTGTHLYENTGKKDKSNDSIFVKIPKLGKSSLIEANWNEADKPSIYPDNNPKSIVKIGTPKENAPVTKLENNPVNSDLQDLGFKNTGKGRDYVKGILKKIITKGEHKSHKVLAQVLSKIVDILPEGITVNVVPNLMLDNKEVGGTYNYESNTLAINPRFDKITLERVFLHELIHAYTGYAIRNPSKLTDNAFASYKSLERLFEKSKAQYIAKNGPITDPTHTTVYGFQNLEEFITEAFTKTNFQNTLSDLEFTDKKSTLQRFKDLITKLIGSLISPSEFHKISGKNTDYLDSIITETLDLLNDLHTNTVVAEKPKLKNPFGMMVTDDELGDIGINPKDVSASPLDISENSYRQVLKSFLPYLKSGQLSVEKLNESIKKIDKFEESDNKEGLILKEICK